jgi:hypothetical protein
MEWDVGKTRVGFYEFISCAARMWGERRQNWRVIVVHNSFSKSPRVSSSVAGRHCLVVSLLLVSDLFFRPNTSSFHHRYNEGPKVEQWTL